MRLENKDIRYEYLVKRLGRIEGCEEAVRRGIRIYGEIAMGYELSRVHYFFDDVALEEDVIGNGVKELEAFDAGVLELGGGVEGVARYLVKRFKDDGDIECVLRNGISR